MENVENAVSPVIEQFDVDTCDIWNYGGEGMDDAIPKITQVTRYHR